MATPLGDFFSLISLQSNLAFLSLTCLDTWDAGGEVRGGGGESLPGKMGLKAQRGVVIEVPDLEFRFCL